MSEYEWLIQGTGALPQVAWSFETDAPLTHFSVARESGETFATDALGQIYRIDRQGIPLATRDEKKKTLRLFTWCDSGRSGAAVFGEGEVVFYDRELVPRWTVNIPSPVIAIAIDPFGQYIAIHQRDATTYICDEYRREISKFTTVRPLKFSQFLAGKPRLLAAGDQSLLAIYDMQGNPDWTEALWAIVGDMGCTGDAAFIAFAAFANGLIIYDKNGKHLGNLALDGTANRITCSYTKQKVFTSTIERKIFAFDRDGELEWGATAPDEIVDIQAGPFGEALYLGLQTGKLLKLAK